MVSHHISPDLLGRTEHGRKRLYRSMAYIDGHPLSRFVGTRSLKDQRKVVGILKQIAKGLEHAHQNGVLHRDLKPGNVLMKNNCTPCITDFGLARCGDSGDESQLTHEGTVLGTPAYMSPEQVEGKLELIGPAADIYSLGVISMIADDCNRDNHRPAATTG
jgi:serine/threonine protein kinase